MADTRLFFKVTHGFTESNKITNVGGDAGWLHLCALDYCARNTTDGFFGTNRVRFLSDRDDPEILAKRLVAENLWHAPGHDCPACPEVPAGMFLIHNYLEHQMSSYEVRQLSSKRAAAGQKGGATKAANAQNNAETSSKPVANLQAKQQQTASKPVAEVEVEVDKTKPKTPPTHPSDVLPPQGGSRTADALPGLETPPAPPKRRGPAPKPPMRLPADFRVTPEMVAWAREKCPHVDGGWQTDKFKSHWTAETGPRAVKKDWVAAWRTWMMNAEERAAQGRGGGSGGGFKPSTTDERVARGLALAEYYKQRGE